METHEKIDSDELGAHSGLRRQERDDDTGTVGQDTATVRPGWGCI